MAQTGGVLVRRLTVAQPGWPDHLWSLRGPDGRPVPVALELKTVAAVTQKASFRPGQLPTLVELAQAGWPAAALVAVGTRTAGLQQVAGWWAPAVDGAAWVAAMDASCWAVPPSFVVPDLAGVLHWVRAAVAAPPVAAGPVGR